MAVTDGLRTRLQSVVPATSGRLDESEFLLAGATAGVVGWGGTQTLAWLGPTNSARLATGLWLVLVGGFASLTVLHGPDDVRFSDVMFVWAIVNGTATGLTVAGLLGVVPETVAFWISWAAASALGYLGTGVLLHSAGDAGRGRGYLVAGIVAFATLVVGVVAFGVLAPVAFLSLGAVHVVPLVVDSRMR